MPKGYHQLTYEQRCQIYTLKERGDNHSEIAKALGVHRSSISRELKRNTGQRGYRYKQAHEMALKRKLEVAHANKTMTPKLISIIKEKLGLQWSPVQISGWLKKQGRLISHETIYKYIWEDKKQGGRLYKELRHRGKKYNKRSKGTSGRGCIPNRIDIDSRPSIVEEKTRLGDWELDTIIGAGQSGAIVSMVERTSKLTKLAKVPNKTAVEVEQALLSKLMPVKEFVFTMTSDNGKEFANHQVVGIQLEAGFYFAKPYHSWERGLNEHTNGLVRQYLPKAKRFDEVSSEDLEKIEVLLNNRPRKVLYFETPHEVFCRLTTGSSLVALRG
jgi:IS30 family transposase